jgi:hypothetical protein
VGDGGCETGLKIVERGIWEEWKAAPLELGDQVLV